MTIETVLIVAGALFAIGLFGALSRRSIIAVIMAVELMFNGVLVAAIGFARFAAPATLLGSDPILTSDSVNTALSGHMFAVFIIAIAAAETALALALVFAFYRARDSVDVADAVEMSN